MKTIVTGGAGFIGSHLVKKLIEGGRKVVIVDDFSSGSMENLSSLGLEPSDFEVRKIDLTDYHQTADALKDGDIIFHLAARIGGIRYLHGSEAAELLTLQENLAIDANVFRACVEKEIKKIIYTSSSAVYPLDKQFSSDALFIEDELAVESIVKDPRFKFKTSINPDGGYGLAKLLAEIQLNLMKETRMGIVRIFNAYGINEPLDERSHAISDLIRKAINYPKKEFVIWGDGRQSRDYVYVEDCVKSLIRMEEKISENYPLTVNIGSGKGSLIREIAKEVIKISGKNIESRYDTTKPVGPISRTADITRARQLLNWEPEVSLEEGLKRTYFWVQKNVEK
ncbi:MAG TPA: NAD-dependent epimerase/dehydratase family protein [Candidatus Humimicrobiaceae bacterium]|nr:NAD-dependent epimerase/dehydratase family protein [Candidatus Humimicrobiaceae bacterium]